MISERESIPTSMPIGKEIAAQALRIVYVAEDIAAISGGAPLVVKQLSSRIAAHGVRVQLVHALGEDPKLSQTVEVFSYPPRGLGRYWSWGAHLRSGLRSLIGTEFRQPILHIHGIWAAPQYFAAREASKIGAPFILTAHGMLEPWLWSKQGWKVRLKKQAYWHAMAYPALRQASVIHAITPLEKAHLQHLFPENRIEVIPNAIDVPTVNKSHDGKWHRNIVFLGRLEPKKGVDILIRAFAAAGLEEDWRLLIAGPSWSQVYLIQLRELVRELGLQGRVEFLGPVFGEQKSRLLASAWIMAVPSHSEVVGLVNLEAAVFHLPTITTPQTGLSDWEAGGGILVQPTAEELAVALRSACGWSMAERARRGYASRQLVQEKYSWQAVLPSWLRLYRSLHG